MPIRVRTKEFKVSAGRYNSFWQQVAIGASTAISTSGPGSVPRCCMDASSRRWPMVLNLIRSRSELEQNIDLNRAMSDSIRLHQACIAPKTGLVAFGSRGQGGDCTSSLLLGSRRTRWTVNAFSFDDFIRRNDIGACNVITMDIEGGEYQVLPTRAGYLQANRPTLKIIRWVGCYKHIYDHGGQELTARRLQTVVRCLESQMSRPATRPRGGQPRMHPNRGWVQRSQCPRT